MQRMLCPFLAIIFIAFATRTLRKLGKERELGEREIDIDRGREQESTGGQGREARERGIGGWKRGGDGGKGGREDERGEE